MFPASESFVVFDIENLQCRFNAQLQTTPEGYLKPVLRNIALNLGGTRFFHVDPWAVLFVDGWVNMALIAIQNSLYFLGGPILNGMLEPALTKQINHY